MARSSGTPSTEAVVGAIREACPGVIINLTTGVIGKDISGPLACLRRVKRHAFDEVAALVATSMEQYGVATGGEKGNVTLTSGGRAATRPAIQGMGE